MRPVRIIISGIFLRRIFFVTILLLLFSACHAAPRPGSTFMSRKGGNFNVQINGQTTQAIAERRISDLDGNYEGDVNWAAAVKSGKLCFNVSPNTKEFGEFYSIGLIIKEIRVDRHPNRWKQYQTVPRPADGHPLVANWKPQQEFCPTEYFLSPRLRYKELPSGQYKVSIRFHGKSNWDKQEIFLEIN